MTAEHQLLQQADHADKRQPTTPVIEDAFVCAADLIPVKRDALRRTVQATLTEIEVLFRDNRWEDALSLFHPLEEKLPELLADSLDVNIRQKLAFALGQLNRFEEAIEELERCIRQRPDDFFLHNAMAYTAYNSLYAAKNREVFLRGKHRAQRIELAHRHFAKAQLLRPDGVTNCYRQGMLFKQIEGKAVKALPLFLKAIQNWERLDEEAKSGRQQERKNYIKALYNGASAALACRHARQALDMIRKCMSGDEATDYIAKSFKYFALGKVHFHLNRFDEAREALNAALHHGASSPVDFAVELLARTYLCLDDWQSALATIRKVPENRRRPYICWTEADALAASGDLTAAADLLKRSAKRDGRSRHKTLVRLARIAYLLGNYQETTSCAEQALAFFAENWSRAYDEGLFWRALGALKGGFHDVAREAALELKAVNPDYPKLNQLLEAIQ